MAVRSATDRALSIATSRHQHKGSGNEGDDDGSEHTRASGVTPTTLPHIDK
jgi:hypothetical protein